MLFLIVTMLGLEESRWSYIIDKMSHSMNDEEDEE